MAFILNSFLSSFYGLLFWVIAARLIPAGDIGLATVVIGVAAMITNLSRLGLDIGLMRYLPTSENKSTMYNTVLIITLVLSLLIALAYLAGLDFLSPTQKFLREGEVSLIFFSFIALTAISKIQNSAISALRRADLMFIQNSILGIRIPLLFFLMALGFTGILISFNIAYLVAIIVGIVILYKYGIGIKPSMSVSSIKDSFRFSFGNYIADVWSALPSTVLPILIINYLGADQTAYFYIASSVAAVLFAVPTAVSTSLFVEGSHDLPLRHNTIRSVKLTALILFPIILAVIVFGNFILSIFGRDYPANSQEIMILMVLSSIFTILPTIYISIKKVQKDILMVNYVLLATSALVIIFGYLLMFKFGIVGIGYAYLIANLLVSISVVFLIIKRDRWIYPLQATKPAQS